MHRKWFRLDNAGRLYASVSNPRDTTLFRVSATLKNKVDENKLDIALKNMIKRFPYFNTHIKKGIFWYYAEENEKKPVPVEEKYYPCMNYDIIKRHNFPFRVLYYKKRISVEFTHAITDGTGALFFLRSLLFEYFKLMGIQAKPDESIALAEETASDLEVEDSFSKYYIKKYPVAKRVSKAFHFPYRLFPKGVYSIVTGTVEIDQIKSIAKDMDSTLTEFLCALYFKSIIDVIEKRGYKKRPVVLNVPVNLRNLYPSKTMRNFFVSLTPSIDPRLGEYSFEEILRYVKNFMEIQVDTKYINQMISRNVKNERNFILRTFPAFIKDLIMPWIYHFYGERGFTSGISNMGLIKMPLELEDEIEKFEVYPAPSSGNILKITTVGYNGRLAISFGKMTYEKEIERTFFRKLVEFGIKVEIETNLE
ncbi:hypothetical protein [Alkalibacter mobilis]|uniref:hypothetical protein n=1 Tax=Alkalibacter mobilis TaxID=2787712 RepID=UPI0018A11262|nr:hypothetical protein [Alkalibacter mobilis]MBF7096037.1 hypothetical protein [Alkalibacter mobilis]